MKIIFKFTAFLFLTALLLACAAAPRVDFAHLGRACDKVPLTQRVITGTLPNGLRYFIMENSRPQNRAHIALVVNAGSVLEREEQRGYAHFVEHMAFNGTRNFEKQDIIDFLRSLGMRFGPDVNAFVSYNETVYHFEIPVENINGVNRIPDQALAILNDWTYAITFPPQEVDLERLVIIEEYRARLGAMERVRNITLPVLFAGSAFENRHPMGLLEVIENATPESLREFYERWYRSDNMALVFVGDFDGRALQTELANHFTMPKAAEPVNRPIFELPPPVYGNFHVQVITDPELTSSAFLIYYKQRHGAARGTLAFFRETIVDRLINSMFNFRFEEALTNPDASATDSWAGVWRWGNNCRFYSTGTSPKTGRAQDALWEFLLEKEEVRRYGFTQSELERAKLNLVSSMERQLSERDRRDSRSYLRDFTSHFLFGADMPDIEWEMDALFTLLPGISLDEITQAVRRYFSFNDRIVFLIAPAGEEESLPSQETISNMFASVRNAQIKPRQTEILTGDLLPQPPSAGTIINRTVDSDTGATILTLSNGTTVILQETANRNNEIVLYALANGGTLNAPQEHFASASLVSEMTAVSGLGPFSRLELIQKLTGVQVSKSFFTTNYLRGFQASSTTSDIKTLFEMLHLFFTQPRLDERAISAMLNQLRTTLVHQNEDPQRFFFNELNRITTNNNPLLRPLETGDLDNVSLEQAFEFLQRSLNPSDYTFVFVGNINKEKLIELSAIYLASIPNAPSMNTWTDPGAEIPGGSETTLNRGLDNRSMVYLGWFASAASGFNEDRNNVVALLSEYLRIVLNDEIRERLGGVYSISAGASISNIPIGQYSIFAFFHCNPQRAGELINAVILHVNNAASSIDMDIFNNAREALLMQHEGAIQRNLHIAQSFANSSVLFNTPLSRLHNRPDSIRAVTPQQVQSLARLITANRPLQLVLFPE